MKKIYKKLYQVIDKNNYTNDILIKKLLETGQLDFLIEKLDSKITLCNSTSIIKKGYLTSEEQFLYLLDNFITYLQRNFPMIEYTYFSLIIKEMLKSEDCKIFLSKHYWGDNKYLNKYTQAFNRIILSNFLVNLSYLSPDCEIKFYKRKRIKVTSVTIEDILSSEEYTEDMLTFLKYILFCNIENQFQAIYLFTNIEEQLLFCQTCDKKKNIEMNFKELRRNQLYFYRNIWDILYKNYKQRLKYVKMIFK